MTEKERMPQRNPNLALAIGLVSILSVVNSALAFIIKDPEQASVIIIVNMYLSIFFIANFLYRFLVAGSKIHYMVYGWGWVDLLTCIPFFQISWVFRGLRAVITFHSLRFSTLKDNVRREGAEFTLFIAIFLVIIILEMCSIFVLFFEGQSPQANITTGQDALWWAYVTIATVGYGDEVPVTSGGRLVGVVLMTSGVAMFATIGGYLAHRLIYRRLGRGYGAGTDARASDAQLAEVQRRLLEAERREKEVLERLERIERMLTDEKMDEGTR